MDDATRMGAIERTPHEHQHRHGFPRRQTTSTLEEIAQLFADEELHHQVGHAVFDAGIEHVDDVRAVDDRSDLRLLCEARARLCVLHDLAVHQLDGDATEGVLVHALVDRTHSTRSDEPSHLVAPGDQPSGEVREICHLAIIADAKDKAHARECSRRDCLFTYFVFPIAKLPAGLSDNPKYRKLERMTVKATHVLVVDDEAIICSALQRGLSRHFDHVTTLTSPRAAIALLEEGARFDAILCDFFMPEMMGNEFAGRLTASQKQRLVFLTGGALTQKAQQQLEEMRRPCLLKPVSMTLVTALVKKVIAERATADTERPPPPSPSTAPPTTAPPTRPERPPSRAPRI